MDLAGMGSGHELGTRGAGPHALQKKSAVSYQEIGTLIAEENPTSRGLRGRESPGLASWGVGAGGAALHPGLIPAFLAKARVSSQQERHWALQIAFKKLTIYLQVIILSKKKPIPKSYTLYDSIYVIFLQ